MKTKSRWIPTTVLAVVVTLITTTLEPAAFARDPEDTAPSKEVVAEKAAPVSLPNRPVFQVAQAAPQTPTSAVPTRTVLPTVAAKPRQDSSKSKKWILIVAAAGAAGATAFLVSRGNSGPGPELVAPVVTIGTPIVGTPQ